MSKVIAMVFAVVGSTLIGLHFDSAMVGIGVYLCVCAAGSGSWA